MGFCRERQKGEKERKKKKTEPKEKASPGDASAARAKDRITGRILPSEHGLLDFCGSLWFVDEGAPSSVLSLTFELVSLNSRRDLVIGDL